MTENTIISKVWNFASVLRDDGVSYGDYLEQITYLLFLSNPYAASVHACCCGVN